MVNKRFLMIVGMIFLIIFSLLIFSKVKRSKIEVQASSADVKRLYTEAVRFKRNNEILRSQEVYQEILKTYPDFENIANVQKELEQLNLNIIFSNILLPNKSVVHQVATGDTLGKIAKQYGITIELIKRSNNIKGDTIRVGQKVRIWTGIFNIYVDKSQNILILKDGNEVIKVYEVSTGENNSTPIGKFKIVSKLVDPVWFHRGVVVPPESPTNVLGSRWLGFDLPGYGIHGTTDPTTIGKQVTAGCVRMLNEEVEELYTIVPMGTEVMVVD